MLPKVILITLLLAISITQSLSSDELDIFDQQNDCQAINRWKKFPRSSSLCIVDDDESTSCMPNSQDYGLLQVNCTQVRYIVQHGELDMNELERALDKDDDVLDQFSKEQQPSDRPEVSTTHIQLTLTAVNDSNEAFLVERQIDTLLTPRPWWKILQQHSYTRDNDNVLLILFERYPLEWYPYLRSLVQTQYPSADTCSKTPLMVGSKDGIHPGFMPVMSVFADYKRNYKLAVFNYFWSAANLWSAKDECPKTVNKWECTFLPLTNCTMPTALMNCLEKKCLEEDTPDFMWGSVYSKAASDGTKLTSSPQSMLETFKPKEEAGWMLPQFKFILPHDKTLAATYRPYGAFNLEQSLLNFLFLTRPNAFYRSKVRRIHQDLKQKNKVKSFTPSTPCVAVHIRRGDRTGFNVNMTEYCERVKHDFDPANEDNKLGCPDLYKGDRIVPCADADDFGCETVPFGAITLHHVINKVPLLLDPPVKDLLVFSDDPLWLEQQIELARFEHPDYHIHTVKAPTFKERGWQYKPHEQYWNALNHFRSRSSDAGAFLHTSIKAAQQCSAFIGHFGSGTSSLFYSAMCVEHAGRYGVCPPQYDFRWGL